MNRRTVNLVFLAELALDGAKAFLNEGSIEVGRATALLCFTTTRILWSNGCRDIAIAGSAEQGFHSGTPEDRFRRHLRGLQSRRSSLHTMAIRVLSVGKTKRRPSSTAMSLVRSPSADLLSETMRCLRGSAAIPCTTDFHWKLDALR
jgi:hypothetical protein